MKKSLIITATVLLFTGCGTLRVIPKGCKTDAVWGESAHSTREITKGEAEDSGIEIKASEGLYVFEDNVVNISELLSSKDIKCEEVKSLRVKITTSWFFVREVSLKVIKK